MGENPIVAVVATLVIVVSIVLMARRCVSNGSVKPTALNFYDVGAGKLYAEKDASTIAPVVAPSGEEGVRAWVYSCTSCADKSSRFISYLEKYTEQGKAALERASRTANIAARLMAMSDNVVRHPTDTAWVTSPTPEGHAIRSEADRRCDPAAAKLCPRYLD